jgi:hypothetical protein
MASHWRMTIDAAKFNNICLLGLGFTRNEAYPNLYYILVEGNSLILFLYVDDLILTGEDNLI